MADSLKNFRVLVSELMEDEPIERLAKECTVDVRYKLPRAELLAIAPGYDGIVVRSETLVDREFLAAATRLKIVGRAGSGLDNIDVEAATERGVIVANTPESNIMSAAEHAFALMLSASRHVAWASSFIKAGNWDRKRFNGRELNGKTLGILGLGRIGALVARRAQGFEMEVVAYDPYIPASRFEKLGVERCESLDELLPRVDFLTIHTPRTDETIGIVGDREIGLMKEGAILVNCARGGLYDEGALERGLASGRIGALGLDVWNEEPQKSHPLYRFDNVVGTPHLGASTFEAQARVGFEVVAEVLAGLRGEIVKNAVNIPSVSDSTFEKLRPFISLAERMGKAYRGVRGGRVEEIEIEFAGPQIDDPEDVKLLSLVVLKGVLDGSVPGTVNFVNAESIARQRGIALSQRISRGTGDYGNLVTLRVREERGSAFELVGTVLEKRHPRIVRMGEYEMDFVPEGRVLHIPHRNVPGVIGKMGISCARYGVNISRMIVSDGSRDSLMLVTVDNPVPPALVAELEGIDELGDVSIVEL